MAYRDGNHWLASRMHEPENGISVVLGKECAKGSWRSLRVDARSHHVYAIGKTGQGKSSLLESMALQDIIAGRGVCFIDPHGDSAERIADRIPRHRINETIYFNAGDREYPIGFNPFSEAISADQRELVASQLLEMFKTLFQESWGEWLEYLLKNCLLTLLAQQGRAVSLVSIQRMLVEAPFRADLVGRVHDPVVRQFWADFFDELRDREALERVSSTLNKVAKFGLSSVIRNIIWPRSGFSLKRAMDTQQVVIVNLAQGIIGSDNAHFLGSLFVSRIAQLAEERAAIPPAARVPFHTYVDEFQTLTIRQFDKVVTELRCPLSDNLGHRRHFGNGGFRP